VKAGYLDTLSTKMLDKEFQLKSGDIVADRYLVQKVIGSGGMGSVYLAKDLHFTKAEKLVALKELFIRTNDSEIRKTIIQNFEREANILAMLDHPAIPKIFDTFTIDTRSYLILELVRGENLESILRSSPTFLPLDTVILWAIELCEVLSYLHHHKPLPIIFRDLKPSNILINENGRITLVDFGIARPFQIGSKGTMIGTEGYSSPEQYRGDASVKTDIYSLGATLHHLLSRIDPRNEAPFSFADRPISTFNPEITSEIEEVITRSLQYDPEDRFATIEDFKKALINAAERSGIYLNLEDQNAPKQDQSRPDPNKVWTFTAKDEIRGSAVLDEGNVIFGSYDGSVYCLDASTGDFLWEYKSGASISVTPFIHKNLVLVGSQNNTLIAIDRQSGHKIWTHQTGGAINSSANGNDKFLVFGCDDGFLRNLNPVSGELIWKYDAVNPIRSNPAIYDNFIFFGTESGELICLNYKGQSVWKAKVKRGISSEPLIDSGFVYISSKDSFLYCFDANSGWLNWRVLIDKASISSPISDQSRVYVGSTSGAVFAINKHNSKEQWRFNAKGQVNSKPLLVRNDLFFTSIDGRVYCLDVKSGKLSWEFNAGSPLVSNPVQYGGLIFFGSTDHSFNAIKANGKLE